MKPILAAALALGILSLASPGGAQTQTSWTMTVDAVNVAANAISVRGVVQGATEQTSHSVQLTWGTEAQQAAALDRCHRSLLLALAKPGQYVATVGSNVCSVALIAP
jgi:hypothetical protein